MRLLPSVKIVASREIKAGEQLYLDYTYVGIKKDSGLGGGPGSGASIIFAGAVLQMLPTRQANWLAGTN